jgi:hypothetical protein
MDQQDHGLAGRRYRFAAVDCLRSTGPGRLQWRLSGRLASGGSLLVDVSGPSATVLPARLADALLEPDGSDGWRLSGGGHSFPLPHSQVFVHEDLGAAMRAAIPPRRVPWSRRLFWNAVFLLMRSDTTRSWLLRRYTR